MDKKILILLPIWKRENITRICLDNLKELKKEFNIDVLCVVSEQWSKVAAFEYGFKYVEAPNDCLGTKMNIGIKEAMRYKFDYLMNLGSDDIITKELFKLYEPYLEKNIDMFGITKVTFIDSVGKEAKEFDYKILIGAGRCIKKEAIENVLKVGDMYDKKQYGMDMCSMAKFENISQIEIESEFGLVYDIKSDVNIWNYKELSGDVTNFERAVKGLTTKQIDAILEL